MGMRQWHKGMKRKRAATSTKQDDNQQDRQADSWIGGREKSSRVVHQAAENEWLNIVDEPATAQAKEEATNRCRAGDVRVPATFGSVAPTD
jgi:hypothetical protein